MGSSGEAGRIVAFGDDDLMVGTSLYGTLLGARHWLRGRYWWRKLKFDFIEWAREGCSRVLAALGSYAEDVALVALGLRTTGGWI